MLVRKSIAFVAFIFCLICTMSHYKGEKKVLHFRWWRKDMLTIHNLTKRTPILTGTSRCKTSIYKINII